jgi:AraC-like DNA-binding protein
MAFMKKKLAFSKMGSPEGFSILFAHHGECGARRASPLHTHAFWQLEVMLEGSITLLLPNGESHPFPAGRSILLPPETPHGFLYPQDRVRWATFKFDCNCPCPGPRLLWLPRSPAVTGLLKTLVLSIDEPRSRSSPIQSGLLCALLAWLLPARGESPYSDLVQNALSAIESARGNPLGVRQLADALHVSAGHLASRFRQETGSTLKLAIDEARAKRAVQLLQFTNLRINEVAAELGFPDGHEFSRFMRRRRLRSPREIRKTGARSSNQG